MVYKIPRLQAPPATHRTLAVGYATAAELTRATSEAAPKAKSPIRSRAIPTPRPTLITIPILHAAPDTTPPFADLCGTLRGAWRGLSGKGVRRLAAAFDTDVGQPMSEIDLAPLVVAMPILVDLLRFRAAPNARRARRFAASRGATFDAETRNDRTRNRWRWASLLSPRGGVRPPPKIHLHAAGVPLSALA